ncbi:MAG: metal ABC transporter permease [Actinomycetota bacterium]|nr:metal ABC transporter permease [Actinomycetota bacterium]
MSFLRIFWPSILAAVVVGAAAPGIGAFVVQKRLSLIGDGVGHIAFAGVALGLWLGISPLAAALIAAIAGALGIDRLRRRTPEEGDLALALFFYGAIAVAVVVASRTGSFNVRLFGFLFGQVLTVTRGELLTIAALGGAVVLVIAGLYRGLLAIAIDEEAAIVAGVPVSALNAVVMVLAATAVGVGMQVVGILLVAALMVLPVGVARNFVNSFHHVLVASAAIGALSAFGGLLISNVADTAPSGTIVLILAALFVLSDVVRRARTVLGFRARSAVVR